MQLQGSVKPFYAGHITGVGEQYRGIAVHRIVFHHPIGAAGRQVLGENSIQNRLLFGVTEQLQTQFSMVVAS